MKNNYIWITSITLALVAGVVSYPLYTGTPAYIVTTLASIFAGMSGYTYLRHHAEKDEALRGERQQLNEQAESFRIEQRNEDQQKEERWQQQMQAIQQGSETGLEQLRAMFERSTTNQQNWSEQFQRHIDRMEERQQQYMTSTQTTSEQFIEQLQKSWDEQRQTVQHQMEQMNEQQNELIQRVEALSERMPQQLSDHLKAYREEENEAKQRWLTTQQERDNKLNEKLAEQYEQFRQREEERVQDWQEEQRQQVTNVSKTMEQLVTTSVNRQDQMLQRFTSLFDRWEEKEEEHRIERTDWLKQQAQAFNEYIDETTSLQREEKEAQQQAERRAQERIEKVTEQLLRHSEMMEKATDEWQTYQTQSLEQHRAFTDHLVEQFEKDHHQRVESQEEYFVHLNEFLQDKLEQDETARQQWTDTYSARWEEVMTNFEKLNTEREETQQKQWASIQNELVQEITAWTEQFQQAQQSATDHIHKHMDEWLNEATKTHDNQMERYEALSSKQNGIIKSFSHHVNEQYKLQQQTMDTLRQQLIEVIHTQWLKTSKQMDQYVKQQADLMNKEKESYAVLEQMVDKQTQHMKRLTNRVVQQQDDVAKAYTAFKDTLVTHLSNHDESAQQLMEQLKRASTETEEVYAAHFKELSDLVDVIATEAQQQTADFEEFMERHEEALEEQMNLQDKIEKYQKNSSRIVEDTLHVQEATKQNSDQYLVTLRGMGESFQQQAEQMKQWVKLLKKDAEDQRTLNQKDIELLEKLMK